jgi:hypothetical protein
VALFPLMAVSYETSALWKQALVLLLIATIPVSSLPLADAHAHENAYAGHSHERSHFVEDHATRHDAEPHADGGQQGTLHVHDLPATALMPVENPILPATPVLNAFAASTLHSRPPDKFSAPLLRPPIA